MLLPGSVLSCLEFELSGYTNSGNSFEFDYNILVIGLSIGPEKPPWHSSQLNEYPFIYLLASYSSSSE